MKKTIYAISLLSLLSLFSCNYDDEGNNSGTRIYDDEGLLLTLEWNTGSGSQQALLDADLDMYMEFKGKDILTSEWTDAFEQLYLFNYYQDENYYLKAKFIDGTKTINYTIYVKGITDTLGNNVHQFHGSMNVNSVGSVENALNISKSGNEYILR